MRRYLRRRLDEHGCRVNVFEFAVHAVAIGGEPAREVGRDGAHPSLPVREERIAREFLIQCRPDVVIAIVDAAALERSLYLAAELVCLPVPLVMVILLVGILAAVAIPEFIDLRRDARNAATQGALGGVRSAIAVARAVIVGEFIGAEHGIGRMIIEAEARGESAGMMVAVFVLIVRRAGTDAGPAAFWNSPAQPIK